MKRGKKKRIMRNLRSWDCLIRKMKIFKDRTSAGKLLARRLKNIKADLILAIPRGGVVVGCEIAKVLKIPLDIIVTRKIGAPTQTELALGAIDPDGEVVYEQALLDQFQISNIKYQIEKEWKEVKRREDLYRAGKKPHDVNGKSVILVDDGIATGSTMLAAINYLKRHKAKKITLAVPVAGQDSARKLAGEVDEAVILETPQNFQAVGQFYQNFLPVSDGEVVQLLMHE